ncbi:MAG TPA: efflux RND transporter permease subunit [Bryobacteraceae bacterium]|nr:efflux RND transporter permease subunit [Bryobacteraceae bacterium]
MNVSETFIRNSVGTTLLTVAVALAGIIAFRLLPVSPLPEVEFPTIMVQALLPGASPQTMASSVATPLERQFGRIAGLAELTSTSSLGATAIVLQFDLSRNIDAAARDVQAAINAARSQLPSSLPQNPTYRKVNPADAPILILGLTSHTMDRGQMYDAAASILAQKLSQMQGVGQVVVGGGALPGVRVELNPTQLTNYGIGLEEVRAVLSRANANSPKGELAGGGLAWTLGATDQLLKAKYYRPLIVAWHNGAAVRLSDLAEVEDSVEDLRNAGMVNADPAVLIIVFRQPGANIIETVDRVLAALPQLRASIPPAMKLTVTMDRTTTIRASVREVEITLLISICLVILVVYLFLRDVWVTLIPGLAVPISLIGTFGVMYLMGYSLDNLSLMALTISTGFVVDDAIVVSENIIRYVEQGMAPFEAALQGAGEIGFTVISISISLIAVFIPLLMMGGIVGRLFREFAVTLSAAVVVSMIVSLTTTPMMCAKILRPRREGPRHLFHRASERAFIWLHRRYDVTLAWVLRHSRLTLAVALGTLAFNIYLFYAIPKGFFPEQDTGRLMGALMVDQDTSFQSLERILTEFVKAIIKDPAVESVTAFGGGQAGSVNSARMFIGLKPLSRRRKSAAQVIGRLRRELSNIPGGTLYLQAIQDLRIGGRLANALYQYTLQSQDLQALNKWGPLMVQKMRKLRLVTDVNTDQQNNGLDELLVVDRPTASRLGISQQLIDDTLYDAFGQRQVSTMFTQLNQYHVVLEVKPEFRTDPTDLRHLYLRSSAGSSVCSSPGVVAGGSAATNLFGPSSSSASTSLAPGMSVSTGALSSGVSSFSNAASAAVFGAGPAPAAVAYPNGCQVPLSAFTHVEYTTVPITVNHQGQFPVVTLSFNLAPGASLGDAVNAVNRVKDEIHMPASIQADFQGTAEAFRASLANEPILILAALVTVYIVLGVLYESYIHPITILSTLPSAGVGALLALNICRNDFSVIALIGIILLIGIVKKNGIMMIDFALEAERKEGMPAEQAIYQACLLRFRPIMMTTMAALLGGLPLGLGTGVGSELRRPLGITMVGGLILSQMLTLYTTPVIYLFFDRLARRLRGSQVAEEGAELVPAD